MLFPARSYAAGSQAVTFASGADDTELPDLGYLPDAANRNRRTSGHHMGPDQTRAGNPACGIAGLLDPPHRLPATVEATLLHEGIGGVLFLETVTRWEPHRNLAFTIRASTAPIPPATLDKHVTITNNRKPRNPTPLKQAPVIHALPHLRGIQEDILLVIKHRSEQPYRIW